MNLSKLNKILILLILLVILVIIYTYNKNILLTEGFTNDNNDNNDKGKMQNSLQDIVKMILVFSVK